ncbi:MAG: hypothetical protein QOE51_3042, partial [Actinoplanes sp.]|nr:hypothetical protein [Actinoplanes sp.]
MRLRSATVFGAVVLTVLAATATPAAARPGPSWARYVVAPASRHVRPVRVLATSGDVTNPGGVVGR